MATDYAEIVEDEDVEGEEESRPPQELLAEYVESANIAELLDADRLGAIGDRAKREYDIDKESRREWEENNREALKLALQVAEKKNYPWPGAANIKYPLLTTAAMQFAARAYPAIVNGPELVKAKVIGRDEGGQKRARGERIARHMSFQLTEEMAEWEEDTDKLLHILPIAGICFRKTYFDPTLGRNKSELVTPDKLIINDGARDIDSVPRITQEFELYPTEAEERFRSGVYRRIELGTPDEGGEDEDAPHQFLEQHRTLDLDDDGYGEPYIVTIHRETTEVVRIVANFRMQNVAFNEAGEIAKIDRDQYFTKFELLPHPGGGFHGIGFGYLLRPINEAVNSVLNQLLDAGHLNNVGGGFIGSGARLRGGAIRFKPGQWVPVDSGGLALRENLVPLPVQQPSAVLFELLGLLIEAGKDISSVKDIMTGSEPKSGNTPATTTMAMIEQGMQMFSAIYKRIYRSLKSEYGKLYRLNGQFLDQDTYFTVLDEQEAVGSEDYAEGDFDIVPVADPNVVTNMQKLARAEFLMQFGEDPHFDGLKIRRRLLEAASIEDVDDLLVPEPPPNPEVLAKADEIDIKKRDQALREQELGLKADKAVFEIGKMKAETMKLIAEAEAAEAGPQIDAYRVLMEQLNERERMVKEAAGDGGQPTA